MKSYSEAVGVTKIGEFDNGAAEAVGVAGALVERTERDPKTCADFAVLARTNAVARGIADALGSHSVPVRRLVEQKTPDDWRLAITALNWLASPKSFAAQKRYLAAGGTLDFEKITGDAVVLAFELTALGVSGESTGLIMARFAELPETATLADLAVDLALQPRGRTLEGEGVYVGTIHSAKGMEFDTVWLVGFEDEIIPGSAKNADVDEERRVAYVGMSRAKRQLVVTWARSRQAPWSCFPSTHTPSRFIAEAGL